MDHHNRRRRTPVIQYLLAIVSLWLLLLDVTAVSARDRTGDSSNFESYFNKILIKLNVSTQTDQYTLIYKTGPAIRLMANNDYKVFLSLDYEFIGFSYGFSPKLFDANDDDVLKGHSSFTNYKLQLFPGQWLQTVSFDKVKGYYIDNTQDFIPGWQPGRDAYITIPDLKTVQWAFSTSYVLNPRFSFKNLIYQTQWQKRSAGSFVPVAFYDYTRTSFTLSGTEGLQKDFNFRLGIGYYHTFIVAHRFYIAPNIVPSLGIRYSRFGSETGGTTTTNSNTYFTRFLDGGLKAGFNSSRWVAGFGLSFNISWYNDDPNTIVRNDKAYGVVYLGFRFGTPRFIANAYQALSDKLP